MLRKKPATLSDKLNKLFAPEEHSEESGDEAAPKFSEFDETPDDASNNAALSEFRKRNIRFLEEFDRKYKGTVSSRNETVSDEDDAEESDEGSDEAEDNFDGDDSSDDEEEEEEDEEQNNAKMLGKHKPKSIVLLKPPHSDDESEENDSSDQVEEEDSEDATDDDRESLTEFTAKPPSTQQQITLIREENRQDTINKGLAVQNQLKIWERLLEMRIKVQPCLVASNSLPPSSSVARNLASQNEEFRQKSAQVTKIVSETMEQMLELQELFLGRYSETKELLKSGSKRKAPSVKTANTKQIALDEYEQILASRCKDMEEYRNSVLMKWHDRTNIASKMRNNPKQSLSVLRKIEDSLINREELVRKTQLFRGGYALLGRQIPSAETTTDQREDEREVTAEPTTTSVYDGEIFDDSDFYHQMLRELIEYKTSTTDSPQEIAKKLAELQKLRNKMKKTVDTKASKGRKIRYVVHNKLVNFMAPVQDYDWTDDAKDELFGSLFGQTPASETI